MDKTRAKPFHPQSNAVPERMIKTIKNSKAKCVNEKQSNGSQQMPYVMMADWSSVQESTAYTPQFLVFGQALSLPLNCMYLNPRKKETTVIHKFVHRKQQIFQGAFELVRRKLNKKQKRRNAVC